MSDEQKPQSAEDWKEKLTPEQYAVLREQGTERPFSGEYYDHKENGMYTCAGCGAALFSSEAKFDSNSGWPSFDDPVAQDALKFLEDTSHGMIRTEVRCKACDGHLGHVFDVGSKLKTGKYYCINSCALDFSGDDQ